MTDSSSHFESYFEIQGGKALKGEVSASGAKNSILPLLFSCLLAEGERQFENAPDLKDVRMALKMLSSLGLKHHREGARLKVEGGPPSHFAPCPESAAAFRAGILCLGPLLARFRKAQLPLPGGCDIGARPIDIHLRGLEKLGAKIYVEKGFIYGSAPEGLKGADIDLKFPSVGASENLIMACALAAGESRLRNTACEPEVLDLISYLNSMGAQITSAGSKELKIKGSSHLKARHQPYKVIPDRIEAGTLLLAGACSKGEVLVKDCRPDHLTALLDKLKEAGFIIKAEGSSLFLKTSGPAKALSIKTGIYPSFPTDLQAQFMALMTQMEGSSSLEETIFENRFRYVEQLNLLGAGIKIKNPRLAFVKGPSDLKGCKAAASDLRAGAGLILAALAAEGRSLVYGLHHIERGYENLFLKLKSLGADIKLCS